jgi:hypothetical protein
MTTPETVRHLLALKQAIRPLVAARDALKEAYRAADAEAQSKVDAAGAALDAAIVTAVRDGTVVVNRAYLVDTTLVRVLIDRPRLEVIEAEAV